MFYHLPLEAMGSCLNSYRGNEAVVKSGGRESWASSKTRFAIVKVLESSEPSETIDPAGDGAISRAF